MGETVGPSVEMQIGSQRDRHTYKQLLTDRQSDGQTDALRQLDSQTDLMTVHCKRGRETPTYQRRQTDKKKDT